MEERNVSTESKFEDEEDEFRSCCADEDELKEREEIAKKDLKNDNDFDEFDEFSARMLFKGVSISEPGNDGCGFSGIGVVIERGGGDKVPVIQVQKMLEFFVDETAADYLALMDGLFEAKRNNIKRVFAFTNSVILFDQITHEEPLENPLLTALKQRTMEHTENLENFVLKCIPDVNLEGPIRLAQVAIGVVQISAKGDQSVENCSICCEEKLTPMIITFKCSHKFCSHCVKSYVDEKIKSAQVPVTCPSSNCRYYISTPEYKSFLPVSSYTLLEEVLSEPNVVATDTFYCPFANCSVLLDPRSSVESDNNCVECPVCRRFICVKCGVPWHSSMSCDEFQELPLAEMDAGDMALDCLAESGRWRRCRMCERMLELTHGCYHMTCWCGYEFCYSCGAEYRDNRQICECTSWDEDEEEDDEEDHDEFTHTRTSSSDPSQHFEEWAWDSFGSLSNMMDAYSDQERSQLALIQRFLAGGFSLSDHHTYPCQSESRSPPRSCTDSNSSYLDNTIKDLHQLPWLERFVSVISDNYYDEYNAQ